MRWAGALTLALIVFLVGCSQPAPPPTPVPTTVPTTAPTAVPTAVPTVVPTATPVPVVLEQRTPTGEYFLGHADAPVTLEMFGDFQCPVCGQFARTIEPPFFKQYVDTGKVRFVWRDFAWIGNESFTAAQAARCAGDQGHFWAYHDYLFAHQDGENLGAFSMANLATFAGAVGLDQNSFAACVNAGQGYPSIKDAVNFGVSQGVDVTPAFLVNGDLKIGAPPLNRLSALMEYYLAHSAH